MWTSKAARALVLQPHSASVLVLRTIPASAALPKTSPLPEEFVEDVSNKPAAMPKKLLRPNASSTILISKTNADDWNKMAPNGLVSAYLQVRRSRLSPQDCTFRRLAFQASTHNAHHNDSSWRTDDVPGTVLVASARRMYRRHGTDVGVRERL